MTTATLQPSAQLRALLSGQVERLAQDAHQHYISAQVASTEADELTATQAAEQTALAVDQAALNTLQQKIADRKTAMGERAQTISAHKDQAAKHHANAQQMVNDVEFLKQQLGTAQPPSELTVLPAGVVAVTGPQPAAPATHTEAATTTGAPECPKCHEELRQDSAGWHHGSTKTGRCPDGCDDSSIVAPALEVSRVIP